jgi:hypothetical protein
LHTTTPLGRPRLRQVAAAIGLIAAALVVGTSGATTADAATTTGATADWSTLDAAGPDASEPYVVPDPSGGLLLVAGDSYAAADVATWRRTSDGWAQLEPATGLPQRGDFAVGYDPVRNRVVAFGGLRHNPDTQSNDYLGDTWTFDGSTWTHEDTPVAPVARSDARMAWSQDLGGIVLYGGTLNNGDSLKDTWLWDGSTWAQLATTGNPPRMAMQAMASDPSTGGVMTFGGYSRNGSFVSELDQTWVLDGTTWTQQSPERVPPQRVHLAAATDPDLDVVTLIGSVPIGASTVETWTWDGSDWTRQNPAHNPSDRSGAALAWAPDLGQTVAFGGRTGGVHLRDLLGYTPNPAGFSTAPQVGSSSIRRVGDLVKLTASVNPNGLPTSIGIAYGTDPDAPSMHATITAIPATSPATYATVSEEADLYYLTPGTTVYVTVTATSDGGTTTGGSLTFDYDLTAPSVAGPGPTVGASYSPTLPLFTWTATDDFSGIDHYSARLRGAAWGKPYVSMTPGSWSGLTTPRVGLPTLAAGSTLCVLPMATDAAGNTGSGREYCYSRPLDDRAASSSTRWTKLSGAAYYNGTARSTKKKGATLTFRAQLAATRYDLIVTKCPTCGKIGIYDDRGLIGKVKLVAARTANKQAVRLTRIPTGAVRIKVLSTAKKVVIDGVLAYRH